MSTPDEGKFLDVHYDAINKVWKSVNYPYGNVTNRSVGEAFIRSMRSLDPGRVLEYHYDVRKERCVKDIYQDSITVATNLQYLGLGRGDVVVLFSGYTSVTSALTFGGLLIGAVMNFFEVQLENDDINSIMDILQPTMILYEVNFEKKVLNALEARKPKSLKFVFTIDGQGFQTAQEYLFKNPAEICFDNFDPVAISNPQSEVAFLVLTSGSTGLPKVIQLSHAAVLNGLYIWWANPFNYEPVCSDSVLFSLSPLRWISQVELLLQSAILGIKRICANQAAIGSYGLQILRETKPTHIFSVPSFFCDVLKELTADDKDSLESLKYIQLGGEYPNQLIMDTTKRHAINSRLFYSYGMSEVSGSITNDEFRSGGKLQPGYQVQILDDNLKPCGPHENGRIAVKTPYPFLGYKGLDNSECFLPNGFFLNGDYGYFDKDNTLHLLARYADLIRSGEVVLIPNSVEELVTTVPDVQLARLVGCGRSAPGCHEVACLFVILEKSSQCSHPKILEKIKHILRLKLPAAEFEVIRYIRAVEEFPLSTCGKIDRIVLKQWASLLCEMT